MIGETMLKLIFTFIASAVKITEAGATKMDSGQLVLASDFTNL